VKAGGPSEAASRSSQPGTSAPWAGQLFPPVRDAENAAAGCRVKYRMVLAMGRPHEPALSIEEE
jgi:hypothetical protein